MGWLYFYHVAYSVCKPTTEAASLVGHLADEVCVCCEVALLKHLLFLIIVNASQGVLTLAGPARNSVVPIAPHHGMRVTQ
jgi:hypothetical protein